MRNIAKHRDVKKKTPPATGGRREILSDIQPMY
jgi:hypothetical protein